MVNKKVGEFLKEHLSFLITILFTYIVGFLLALIAFFFKEEWRSLSTFEAIKSFAEAIIPTTVTYVFVSVFENVIKMIKGKTEHYIWNVITIVSVFLYLIAYTFYHLFWDSWIMVMLEVIFTIILLMSTILSYKEMYISSHRNHNIVPT